MALEPQQLVFRDEKGNVTATVTITFGLPTALDLTLTCSADNCSKPPVFYTTRQDVALKRRLAWCAECFAEKAAKYPLQVERVRGKA